MARRKQKKPAPKLKRPPPPRETISVPRPRATARQRRTKSQVQQIVADAYKAVFTSPLGEIVKADLMQWCNVFNPIAEADPINLGIRIGERNVALRIAQMMGLRPEHFPDEAWKVADEINAMAGA
jgi:hypothetical protein